MCARDTVATPFIAHVTRDADTPIVFIFVLRNNETVRIKLTDSQQRVSNLMTPGLPAVSYTHLDVYKRQVRDFKTTTDTQHNKTSD